MSNKRRKVAGVKVGETRVSCVSIQEERSGKTKRKMLFSIFFFFIQFNEKFTSKKSEVAKQKETLFSIISSFLFFHSRIF